MSSTNLIKDDIVYIPFWIVLEYLDAAPPEPFIECKIIRIEEKSLNSPDGSLIFKLCDLELCKPNLIAPDVPYEFLITKDQLGLWANKIANWFLDYAKSHDSKY